MAINICVIFLKDWEFIIEESSRKIDKEDPSLGSTDNDGSIFLEIESSFESYSRLIHTIKIIKRY